MARVVADSCPVHARSKDAEWRWISHAQHLGGQERIVGISTYAVSFHLERARRSCCFGPSRVAVCQDPSTQADLVIGFSDVRRNSQPSSSAPDSKCSSSPALVDEILCVDPDRGTPGRGRGPRPGRGRRVRATTCCSARTGRSADQLVLRVYFEDGVIRWLAEPLVSELIEAVGGGRHLRRPLPDAPWPRIGPVAQTVIIARRPECAR